jgi:hypothetical protein
MQAKSMAAPKHIVLVILQETGVVSPQALAMGPDSVGRKNNRHIWAGILVFDPRSIRRPLN